MPGQPLRTHPDFPKWYAECKKYAHLSPWNAAIEMSKVFGGSTGTWRDRVAAMRSHDPKKAEEFERVANTKKALEDREAKKQFSIEEEENRKTIVSVSESIKTLDEALEAGHVDLDVWEVERHVINKWDGFMKEVGDKTTTAIVVPLWQVKVWLRRKIEKKVADALHDFAKDLIANIRNSSPYVKRIPHKPLPDPCLCELDFFDLHLGKLAWGKESGQDFDLKIARQVYTDSLMEMVERLKPYQIEKFLFPVGNDYYNVNASSAETYAGTPQSEDDRWKKTFVEGWKLIRDSVEILSKIAPVDVLVVPGNHDYESAFYMGEVLSAIYKNNKNVMVDNSPPVRKYYRYGSNLIGFTHGKDEKLTELPLIMANERGKDFGEAKFKEWHVGDKHHKKEYYWLATEENKGVVVRLLRSLTANDQWHYQKGYIGSIRAGEAFVWHKKNGLICNLSVNV